MQTRKTFVIPILVVLTGATWLLNTLALAPQVDWMWTVGLAAAGVLVLVVGGLNTLTVAAGPLLLIASVAELLRQTGFLALEHEIPILVIVLGLLWSAALLSGLPVPEAFRPDAEDTRGKTR